MNAVRRAADLLFHRQLRLRWQGGPRLAWEARDADAVAAQAEAQAQRRREANEIVEQLAGVLDEMPEIRDSVRHLAFVEQALRTQGLKALDGVPLEVLEQAHAQFEGLVSNWSPRGLATLRSKMAVTIAEREARGEPSEWSSGAVLPSAAAPGAKVRFNVGQG